MIGAGIHEGDLLIVDRSVEPENENYQTIQVTVEMEFEVWGVVTNVVHAL
jgi:DNA polymerase V